MVFKEKCCRRCIRNPTRNVRLYKRGSKMVKKDLDLVRIIKKLKRHSIMLWCLMTESQRKFSHKVAEPVLSEYSSLSEEGYGSLKREVESRGHYFDQFSSDGAIKGPLDIDNVMEPMLKS